MKTSCLRRDVAILILAVITVGCVDQEAAQRQEAQENLEQAMALIAQAERGFADGASPNPGDVSEYRQRQFRQAAALLQSAMTQGSPAQESTARRLLATLHESAARQAAQDARQQWLALGPATTEILRRATALTRAQNRVDAINLEQAPTIQTLEAYGATLIQSRGELAKSMESLGAVIADLDKRHQAAAIQRAQAAADARSLRDQAFIQEGQAQFELYLKALDADRRGQVADAQAEQFAAQRDLQAAEMTLVRTRFEQVEWAIASVDSQIASTRQRHQEAQAQLRTALGDADNPASVTAAVKALVRAFTALDEAFVRNVQPGFDQALSEADRAIALLQGRGGVDARDRRTMALELVAAQTSKAALLSDLIASLGALGRCYEAAVAAVQRPKLGQETQPLVQRLSAVRTQQAPLIQAAEALIKEAREGAAQAAGAPAPPGAPAATGPDAAASLAGQLDVYSRRIEQAGLAAPQPQ